MKAADAINIADLEKIARRRLPPVIFDTIAGGAMDEVTLRANRAALERIQFRPRALADVSSRELSTTVLGQTVSMPVLLAPTGRGRAVHRDGELAVRRAAGEADTIYMQSTFSKFTLEEVAQAATTPAWFQLYQPSTREATEELLGRVAAAGYTALAVTIDNAVFGRRERDLHNRAAGRKLSSSVLAQSVLRPRWSLEYLRGNLSSGDNGQHPGRSLRSSPQQILSPTHPVTWDDLRFIRELWDGPLLIKGVMRADECDELIAAGVDGLIVSNHGGRQLDGLPPTIEVLPSVVEAVDGRAEVFVDGGIRRGGDVAKALALGAKACLIGRPYLYGLAADGQAGIARCLEILRAELDNTMALLGCTSVAELDSSFVTHAEPTPASDRISAS